MSDNFDRRAEAWYESKVTFMISIMVPLVVILSFLFGMRQDIALVKQNIDNINTNHEAHIQDILQALKGLQEAQNTQEAQIIELQKQLISVLGRTK